MQAARAVATAALVAAAVVVAATCPAASVTVAQRGEEVRSGPAGTLLSYLLPDHLNEPLSREAAFPAAGGELLVAGGVTGAAAATSSAELLATASGASRSAGSVGSPVAEAAGVALGADDLLLGGAGADGRCCSSNVVAVRPERRGKVVAAIAGHLPAPRSGAAAAVIGTTIYLAGGYGPTAGGADEDSVLESRDGRHFAAAASLARAVRYPAAVVLGGSLYVIGGESVVSGAPEPVDDVQLLSPGGGRSVVVAHLPEPVVAPEAWVSGGRLLVAGGDSALSPSGTGRLTNGSIWSYVPRRRLFELIGELSLPVSHAAVVATASGTYLVGGEYEGEAQTAVQVVATPAVAPRRHTRYP